MNSRQNCIITFLSSKGSFATRLVNMTSFIETLACIRRVGRNSAEDVFRLSLFARRMHVSTLGKSDFRAVDAQPPRGLYYGFNAMTCVLPERWVSCRRLRSFLRALSSSALLVFGNVPLSNADLHDSERYFDRILVSVKWHNKRGQQ